MRNCQRIISGLFFVLLFSSITIIGLIPQDNREAYIETAGISNLNAATTKLWEAIWEKDSSEEVIDLEVGSDRNVYVTVRIWNSSASRYKIGLLKYDSQGRMLWERIYNQGIYDRPFGMALDSLNNIYVTGYTTGRGAGGENLLLLKYDSNGNFLWDRIWGGSGNDDGDDVDCYSDNTLIVLGDTTSYGAGLRDTLLLKYDTDGNYQWYKTWGGSQNDAGNDLILTPAGDIYIVGNTYSFGAGGSDALLIKYDLNGTRIWNRTQGTSGNNFGLGIASYGTDAIYFSIGRNLTKFNSLGIRQWTRTWTGIGTPRFSRMDTDSAGNVYIIGDADTGAPKYYEFLLAKFNSTGDVKWNYYWGGTSNEQGFSINLDITDNIYVGGYSNSFGESAGENTAILKITQNFMLGTDAGDPDVDGLFNLYWEPSVYANNYSLYQHLGYISEINGSVTLIAAGITKSNYSMSIGVNGSYYYIIQGVNSTHNITTNCIRVDLMLYPPAHFALSTDAFDVDPDGTFNLNWDKSVYADNYSVYEHSGYIDTINGSVKLLGRGMTQRTFAISDRFHGIYFYKVVAFNKFGNMSSNCLMVRVCRSLIWYSLYGNTDQDDYPSDMAQDSSGNLFIVGTIQNVPSNTRMVILKYNTSGNLQWSRERGAVGWAKGNGITVDSSGNLYAVGSIFNSSYQLFLVKYDNSGNFQWERQRGGSSADKLTGIAVDSKGNLIAVGTTESYGAGLQDIIVIKYDKNGNYQWNVTWGGPLNDLGSKIVLDESDNIYISGQTNSTGAGGDDLLVIKFNSTGKEVWNTTWGTPSKEGGAGYYPLGIELDSNNNTYLAGNNNTRDTYGWYEANSALLKFDNTGHHIWNKTWGDPDMEEMLTDVVVDSENNVYTIGKYWNNRADAIVYKFNSTGALEGNVTWGTNGDEMPYSLILDESGYIYLTGWFVNQTSFEDYIFLTKLSLNPEQFTLTTDADTPDTNGNFVLTWDPSILADNYSIYVSNHYMYEIDGSATLLEHEITNRTYSVLNYADGTYYFIIVAHNRYGNTTSNCIRVDVVLSLPGAFTLSSTAKTPDRDGNFNLNWTVAFEAHNYSIFESDHYITEFNETVLELYSGLNNLSCIITGLANGAYYFRAVAFNSAGNTSSNCIYVNVTFGYPRSFSISSDAIFPDGDGKFTISWNAVDGAKNYSIYYSTSSISVLNGDEIEIDNGIVRLSYYVIGVSASGYRYFAVMAHNDYGDTLSSNYLSIWVSGTNPVKPGFFDIYSNAENPDYDGNFNITWGISSGANNYSIYQSTMFIDEIQSATRIIAGNTNRTLLFSDYETGTFYFRVVAFDFSGNNRTSKCIKADIERGPPGIFSLSSDAYTPDFDGYYNLIWSTAPGALNYSIYNCTGYITEINSSVHLMVDGYIGTTFPLVGISNGIYYYIILSFNNYGNTSSNCLRIEVQLTPPGVFILSTDADNPDTDGQFNLTWSDSSQSDYYTIYSYSSFITEINESLHIEISHYTENTFPITVYSNRTYYFIIAAFNMYSNTSSNCITINISFPAPGPFLLSSDGGTPDRDGNFNLIWNISTNAKTYSVYNCSGFISEVNETVNLMRQGLTELLHPVYGLQNGTYYYIIVAFTDYGNRTSNCISVIIELLPPQPFILSSNVVIIDIGDNFTLSWTFSEFAKNYSLYIYNGFINDINESVTLITKELINNSVLISGLNSGIYYFLIAAFNDYGNISSNCIQIIVQISHDNDGGQGFVDFLKKNWYVLLIIGIGSVTMILAIKSRRKRRKSKTKDPIPKNQKSGLILKNQP